MWQLKRSSARLSCSTLLRADPIGRGLRQEKAGLHLSYLPQLQTNAAELCKLGERACRKAGPQGPEGPAFAPRNFLAAVPDIRVELEKVIFAGNYVTVHMKFSGRLPPYSARCDGKVNRSPSSPPIWPKSGRDPHQRLRRCGQRRPSSLNEFKTRCRLTSDTTAGADDRTDALSRSLFSIGSLLKS